jgi:hypothetical protein
MTERQIIIDGLVGRPDNEAHPDFTRVVMTERGLWPDASKYSSAVHLETIKRHEDFLAVCSKFSLEALRAYYESLDALSLVECFDGWCCHQYR